MPQLFERFAHRWPATMVFCGVLAIAIATDVRFVAQSGRERSSGP